MSKNFLDLGILAQWVESLEKMSIFEPTDVQSEAIPVALEGKNILAQSATGTGKTLAYLLPIVQQVDAERPVIQAVILAPTNELAMQIFRQLELLLQNAGSTVKSASLIGGANIQRQVDKLKTKPQIIVGSAGRIIELQKKGKVKLGNVKSLVLDEVDKLVDDQQHKATLDVVKVVPADCQYLLFSATITRKAVSKTSFIDNLVHIWLKDEVVAKANIEHWYFIADFRDKIEVLRKLSKILSVKRGLVFVNKLDSVEKVLDKLQYHGLKAVSLSGSGDKMARKRALEDFTKGKVQLLIASDIAARGLDIADVDYVFNVDMPENEKVYLHRTGRTGRAGKNGIAISLVAVQESAKLADYAKKIDIKVQPKKMANGKVVDFLNKPHANGYRITSRDFAEKQGK